MKCVPVEAKHTCVEVDTIDRSRHNLTKLQSDVPSLSIDGVREHATHEMCRMVDVLKGTII